jgi:hypothetical protein
VLRPIHTLDEQTAAMISSLEHDAIYSGTGKNRKLVGHTNKVKLWDKVTALRTLAQHFKLLEPEEPTKRPLQIIITDAPASGHGSSMGRRAPGTATMRVARRS